MKIKISKRFIKDIEKITDQRLLIKLRQVIIEATNAQNLYSITNITALVGYSNYYRIKFDYRYRIGIYLNNETIEFLRLGTREDFYKNFP